MQSKAAGCECLPALCRPLYVTVVYQGKCSHCMRIGVAVPVVGTVARLREAVSSETKIPTEQVMSWACHWVPSLQQEGVKGFCTMLGM